MKTHFDRAQTIAETLPYLQRHRGATLVVKYGGAAMTDPDVRLKVLKDVVLLRLVGLNPIIVHGGGPDITALMDRLGVETRRVQGCRVTDADTMQIVEMALAGTTNKGIVRDINRAGGHAVGISGVDGGLLRARPFRPEGQDIGFVGEVESVDPRLLTELVSAGYLPVIAPIGVDDAGCSFNINADTAAAAIGGALHADKFIMLTDVPGVLLDLKDPASLVSSLTVSDARTLIETGQISGGMVPKVLACLAALDAGVARCHIIDGRQPHALLVELFTDGGIGTMVVPDAPLEGPRPRGPVDLEGPRPRGPVDLEGPRPRGPADLESPRSRGPADLEGPRPRGPVKQESPRPRGPADLESPRSRGPVKQESPRPRGPADLEGPRLRGPVEGEAA